MYFGDKPWDGPRSLFDMLDVWDERLYRFLSDYKLNLVSPADMAEEESEKFHTELGYHFHSTADRIFAILSRKLNHRRGTRNCPLCLE